MRHVSRLILVVPLVGLLLIGFMALRKSAPVARQIHRLVLSQMSLALRTDVSASRITGNWWTGITFHDMVVARDSRLPGGALFRAKSVRVRYFGRQILKGMISPVRGVKDITVVQPTVNIRRDAKGSWNVAKLIPPPRKPRRREFAAKVTVRDARVTYRDQLIHTPEGSAFFRDLRSVSAVAQFNGEDPVTLRASAEDKDRKFRHARTTGIVTADGLYVEVTTHIDDADGAFFSRYLLKDPAVHVASAHARGQVHLIWAKGFARDYSLSVDGKLWLKGGELSHHDVKYPFRHVEGPITFSNQNILLKHVTGNFGDSRFDVSGSVVGLKNPTYSLSVQSNRLNVTELMALGKKPTEAFTVESSGYASGVFKVAGGKSFVAITGKGQIPRMTVKDKSLGEIHIAAAGVGGAMEDLLHPAFNGWAKIPSLLWSKSRGGSRQPALPEGLRGFELREIRNISLRMINLPEHPAVLAEFDVPHAVAGGIPVDNLHVRLDYQDRLFMIREARFDALDGKVNTRGQVELRESGPVFAFSGEATGVESRIADRYIRRRLVVLSGKVSGPFEVKGNNESVQVETDIEADQLEACPTSQGTESPWQGFQGERVRVRARGHLHHTNKGWSPEVEGDATAQEGNFILSGESYSRIPTENMSGHFLWHGNDLTIGELRTGFMEGTLWLAGGLKTDSGKLNMRVAGFDWNLARLPRFASSTTRRGTLNLQGDLSGLLGRPDFDGRVEILDADIDDLPVAYASGNVHFDHDAITLSHGLLWQFGGRYLVDGRLTNLDWQNNDAQLNFDVHGTGVGISPLMAHFFPQSTGNSSPRITGLAQGTARVEGTLKGPRVECAAEVRGGEVYGIPVEVARLSASYANRELTLKDLNGTTNGATFVASGIVHANHAVQFDFRGTHIPAVLVGRPVGVEIPVSGNVDFEGNIGGTSDAPRVSATLTTDPLTISGERVGSLAGTVAMDRDGMHIARMEIIDVATDVRLSGYVPFNSDNPGLALTLETRKVRGEDLLKLITGSSPTLKLTGKSLEFYDKLKAFAERIPQPIKASLQAKAVAKGSLNVPEITGDFTLTEGDLRGQPLPRTSANLIWKNGTLMVENFRASQGDAVMIMESGKVLDPEGRIEMDFDIYNADLNLFKPWVRNFPDAAGLAKNVSVTASGLISEPEITFSADVDEFKVGKVEFDRLSTLPIRISDNKIHIEKDDLRLLKGRYAMSLWGDVPFNWQPLSIKRDGPIELHVQSRQDEDLAVVPLFAPGVKEASGRFSFDFGVSGTLNSPEFGGSLNIKDGTFNFVGLKTPLQHVDARLQFASGTNELMVEGLKGSMGTGTFSAGGKVVVTSDGLLDPTRNRYAVNLQSHGLTFDLRPYLDGTFNVNSDLAFNTLSDKSGKEVLRLAGLEVTSSGGGSVTVVTGQAGNEPVVILADDWLQKGQWARAQIEVPLIAKDLRLQSAKTFNGQVDADLRVTNRNGQGEAIPLTVVGDVEIKNASLLGLPTSGEQTTYPQLPAIPELDLYVELKDGVNINMRRLTVSNLQGSGTVKWIGGQPDLRGTVTARRGLIDFPTSDAHLRSARVDIMSTADPVTRKPETTLNLDITADARVDQYNMRISMVGPVVLGKPDQEFPLRVQSTPPIPGSGQSDALMKLLGQPVGQTFTEADQAQRIYKSLASLFQQLPVFADVETAFKTVLGIDTFSVDYTFGEAVNVRAGKEIAKGLFLSYRRTISGARLGYEYRLDYRIGKQAVIAFQGDDRGLKKYSIEREINF